MSDKTPREIRLEGIGASPGICIGKAYLVDKEGVDVVKKYYILESSLQSEKNRFKAAVKKVEEDLHEMIDQTPEEFREHANILETHIVLLKDKMLYGKIIETIDNELVNAEWALKKVVSNLKSIFNNLADPYFRERAADIVHVSDRIMRNLVGVDQVNIKDIDKRVVLVAHDLSPAETSQIQLEKIQGFITESGGMTSHTGIIARTLEIPAIVGLANAMKSINNEDLIILDGINGLIIINPTEESLVEYIERQARYEEFRAEVARGSHFAAETRDGVSVEVMGNIELPEEVVSVKDYGGDGIGLYRTEFQYLSSKGFPTEFDLFDKYRDVVEVMSPKSVTIRTLDINGDKAVAYATENTVEQNPALGLRAIRYCLGKPDVFKIQLRAILRAAAYGHVRILIPMISCLDEVLETKKMLKEAADSLEEEGVIHNRDIEVGIMIEVPSAVIMADILAKEVDFFSIGTNDLIQYSMAIDRGNRHVAHLYNPLHPAIIRLIKHVSDVARNAGIPIYMCGEMAAAPLYIPILLGIGMDELSMNPQSIPAVKSVIRAIDVREAKDFVGEVLNQSSADDILNLVQSRFGDILPKTDLNSI